VPTAPGRAISRCGIARPPIARAELGHSCRCGCKDYKHRGPLAAVAIAIAAREAMARRLLDPE